MTFRMIWNRLCFQFLQETIGMRRLLRARNIFFSLLVLVVGCNVQFAYRTNNICNPGDHLIQSDAEAIERAKNQIFRAGYVGFGPPDEKEEKPGYADFSRPDCCKVTSTRTAIGVIIWKVELDGETIGGPKKRRVVASMWLSNCGAVFTEDSSVTTYPLR
jgi:hypothetical protein